MKPFFILVTVIIILGFSVVIYYKSTKTSLNVPEKLSQLIEEIEQIHVKNLGDTDLKIPKNIIQITPDINNIPPEFKENIEYVKTLNPTWNYMLYDNTSSIEYIKKVYPTFLPYYLAINPKYGAARADFFRYLILYELGGVYLDIKSATKYPLDNILYPFDEYVLSHWGGLVGWPHEDKLKKYGEFQQWHIICIPKHPALKAVIDNVIKNICEYDIAETGVGKQAVLETTGPIVYTKSILPFLYKHNFRIAKSNEDIGLIYNNLKKNHEVIFGKAHYSNCKEPVILPNDLKLINLDIADLEKYIELDLAEHCDSMLELGDGKISAHINKKIKISSKHLVIDPTAVKTDDSNHKILNKSIEKITDEDVEFIRPISCIIIYCSNCLKKLSETKSGIAMIKEAHNILDKTDNIYVENILRELDFVITDTGITQNSNEIMNVYSKVLGDGKPSWEILLIKSGGTPYKFIDKNIQLENLILIKQFFDRYNIRYFIDCSTLLGFFRDNKFIDTETKTEISIDKRDIHLLQKNIGELTSLGFTQWRNFENNGWLALSLTRKGEYTDIYKNFEINFPLANYTYETSDFKIPINASDWLLEMYGVEWDLNKNKKLPRRIEWEKGMPTYMLHIKNM